MIFGGCVLFVSYFDCVCLLRYFIVGVLWLFLVRVLLFDCLFDNVGCRSLGVFKLFVCYSD